MSGGGSEKAPENNGNGSGGGFGGGRGEIRFPTDENGKIQMPDFPNGGNFGHGGSDFYVMWNFAEKIKGNPEADIIDVYEAIDMFLPGILGYRSILNGNIPIDIPNLRDKKARDEWRNDTACTIPEVAGDMLLPTCATGTPEIEDEIYDRMKKLWEEECEKKDGSYRASTFKQGMRKKN